MFANRRERFAIQGFMVVAVTTMVASGLAVVSFLDHLYGNHDGSIEPEAMQRTLESMEERMDAATAASVRCDGTGNPLADA